MLAFVRRLSISPLKNFALKVQLALSFHTVSSNKNWDTFHPVQKSEQVGLVVGSRGEMELGL